MNYHNYLKGRYPEITGETRYPVYDGRPFAAGSALSTNFQFDKCSDINKHSAPSLCLEGGWNLLGDGKEALAAGYTKELLSEVSVWYGPTTDGERLYYTVFAGGIGNAFKQLPSMLVCFDIKCNKVVYVKNCSEYTRLPGEVAVCRVAPAIHKDTLYITTSFPVSTGPVLIAVHKCDGSLKWVLPYYPPVGGEPNLRMGDSNITVSEDGIVTCGTSSLQNTPYNSGLRSPSGFPVYTDQGRLCLVRDDHTHGTLLESFITCPLLLKKGDTVLAGGIIPEYDPFLPGWDYTVIGTISVDKPVDMYVFDGDKVPLPPPPCVAGTSPIAAVINISPGNPPVFKQSIWKLWETIPGIYVGKDRQRKYTTAELISDWSVLDSGSFMVWTYLDEFQMGVVMNQPGNGDLYFYKKIASGAVIENEYDAQGLNYYGNGVWSAPPTTVKLNGDKKIYYGTGQCHSLPFLDKYFDYLSPSSFTVLSRAVEDVTASFIAGSASLNDVNAEKEKLCAQTKAAVLNAVRSPRGEFSYADAVMCVGQGQEWGIRTIFADNYTFIENDPDNILVGIENDIDGDLSSGVQLYFDSNSVAVTPKSGLGVVINLLPVATYFSCSYIGPHGLLGGTNYQNTQSTSKYLYGVNAKEPGRPMVTRWGDQINTSFAYSFNVETGAIDWTTELFDDAVPGCGVVNGCIYCADGAGGLYSIDTFSGNLLWYRNNAQGKYPTFGGVSTPTLVGDKLYWCPGYAIPFVSTIVPGSAYGIVLGTDSCNTLDGCRSYPYSGTYRNENRKVIKVVQRWCGRQAECRYVLNDIRYKCVLTVEKDGRVVTMHDDNFKGPASFSCVRVLSKETFVIKVTLPEYSYVLYMKKED